MLTKLTHLTVFVTNQDEALKFYTENLGFLVHTDAMFGEHLRWLTIMLPGDKDLEISLLLAETPEEKALVGKQAATKPLFAFSTEDCQKTYDTFKQRGVKMTSAPEQQPWGISMACEDLYGNAIYVVQNL